MKTMETRWFKRDDLPICEDILCDMFAPPKGKDVQFVLSKAEVTDADAVHVTVAFNWCDGCGVHHPRCRTTDLAKNLNGHTVFREGARILASFFEPELAPKPKEYVGVDFWLECYYR